MFFLLGSGSGSPLEARQTHRGDLAIILILLIAFAVLLGIAFIIWLRIKNYYKSEEYLEKERTRKTKLKDVQNLAKDNNLSQTETDMLWEICRITDANNIIYSIKSNNEVNELFHTAYEIMKEQKAINMYEFLKENRSSLSTLTDDDLSLPLRKAKDLIENHYGAYANPA